MPDESRWGGAVAELLDLVFGEDWQQGLMELRMEAFLEQLGDSGELTAAQARVTNLVKARVRALTKHALRNLDRWTTSLRAIANHLEDLHTQSRHALDDELGLQQNSDDERSNT